MRLARYSALAVALAAAGSLSLAACGEDPPQNDDGDAGTDPALSDLEAYFSLQKGRCFEYTLQDSKQPNADLGVAVELARPAAGEVDVLRDLVRLGVVAGRDDLDSLRPEPLELLRERQHGRVGRGPDVAERRSDLPDEEVGAGDQHRDPAPAHRREHDRDRHQQAQAQGVAAERVLVHEEEDDPEAVEDRAGARQYRFKKGGFAALEGAHQRYAPGTLRPIAIAICNRHRRLPRRRMAGNSPAISDAGPQSSQGIAAMARGGCAGCLQAPRVPLTAACKRF